MNAASLRAMFRLVDEKEWSAPLIQQRYETLLMEFGLVTTLYFEYAITAAPSDARRLAMG